jgi:hypothetical protein
VSDNFWRQRQKTLKVARPLLHHARDGSWETSVGATNASTKSATRPTTVHPRPTTLDLEAGRWKKVVEAMDGDRNMMMEDLSVATTCSSAAMLKMRWEGRGELRGGSLGGDGVARLSEVGHISGQSRWGPSAPRCGGGADEEAHQYEHRA